MRLTAVFLVFIPGILIGQDPTVTKALNHFVAYGNQSAEEVQSVSQSIINYYSAISDRRDSSWPRFGCPVQPEEFYYKQAVGAGTDIAVGGAAVKTAFEELRKSAERIDLKCKALDTYHKLEDHRKDNYDEGKKLVKEMLGLIGEYHAKQGTFRKELMKRYAAIRASHAYNNAVNHMQEQMERERSFLDLWTYNLNEQTHTEWIEKQLSESILETAAELKKMEALKPELKYPASGMWPSFLDGMRSILDMKRNALDQYNHEARKSDRHANATYANLINYYNGVLGANFNTFIEYATNDKFYGLKAIAYVPRLEIRSKQQDEDREIAAFKDEQITLTQLPKQSRPINQDEFAALENYIDFVNESYRQLSHQRDVISNLNSRTAYFAGLTSYTGRGSIQFTHDGFSVPLSYYETAISESKILNPEIASVLNTRARVLLDILKEMDQIGMTLEKQTADKLYEKDACKNLYVLIERTKFLYDTWDASKESLFED